MGKKCPEEGPGAAEPPAPTLGPLGVQRERGSPGVWPGQPCPGGICPSLGRRDGKVLGHQPRGSGSSVWKMRGGGPGCPGGLVCSTLGMNSSQSTWRAVFPTSTVTWGLSPNTAAPAAQEGPGWPPGPPPPLATSRVLADHGMGGGSLALPRAAPGPHSSARLAQGRLLGLQSWWKSGSHEDGLPPP